MMTDELRKAREDEVDAGRKLLFAAQAVYEMKMSDGDFWDVLNEYGKVCERRRKLIEQSSSLVN